MGNSEQNPTKKHTSDQSTLYWHNYETMSLMLLICKEKEKRNSRHGQYMVQFSLTDK